MDKDIFEQKKEKVFSYIRSKEYIPLKIKELMVVLDVPSEEKKNFITAIEELEQEGKILISKKGKIMSPESDETLVSGVLQCSGKGFFAFLRPDDPNKDDIYIAGENLAGALHNDRVLVKKDTVPSSRRREGYVTKILKRGNTTITGIITVQKDGTMCLCPDDPRIYAKIKLNRDDPLEGKDGDRAAAEITEYKESGKIKGRITQIFGDGDSLKSCIEAIIYTSGIKKEFDPATVYEANRVHDSISEEEIKGRTDLRNDTIFTIDGDDARDFDDAVSISILPDGCYRLGVHIADVTHYVKEGSALDEEAYIRGTSVYFPDRVIPMLPQKLSNGICSLNPNVDRLTLSVIMDIDASGEVKSHQLVKSVIRSKERLTYNNVNKILEENDPALSEKYSHILADLETMEELAKILNEKRVKRGAIQLEIPETKIIVDEDGNPVKLEKDIRGTSNRMIEEFMLAANETIAEYAFWAELPFVYRVHEAPSIEKLNSFNAFIQNFGLKIKGKFDDDTSVHTKELQRILEAAHGTPNERMVSATMLRSLMKAEYSPENKGHFGLAAKYYCHFTSPIRRYPDLAIHRILKDFISGDLTQKRISELTSFTARAALHSSETETAAETAERDVNDLMITAYMSQFVGEEFTGIVSTVTGFGMFVELENSAEGLVHLENMTDDYYHYSEGQNILRGERTGREYKIGDTVQITVARCNLLTRQIDFVLSKDASPKLLKAIDRKDEKKRLKETKKSKDTSKKKSKRKNNKNNRRKK